ncbi:hypothetical protein [Parafrankia sp. BMG5.11]|nr:hypothetical protein [Parafrankia sp. BMG5.11]
MTWKLDPHGRRTRVSFAVDSLTGAAPDYGAQLLLSLRELVSGRR